MYERVPRRSGASRFVLPAVLVAVIVVLALLADARGAFNGMGVLIGIAFGAALLYLTISDYVPFDLFRRRDRRRGSR